MKKYTIYKIGTYIVFYGILFNIVYSLAFGWNSVPQSDLERLLDKITNLVINCGLIMIAAPILSIYAKSLKNYDYEKEKEKRNEKSFSWYFDEESK